MSGEATEGDQAPKGFSTQEDGNTEQTRSAQSVTLPARLLWIFNWL